MDLTNRESSAMVVLVHGFAAKRLVMYPLGYGLHAYGHQVSHWTYQSLFNSISTHAERFSEYLESSSDIQQVHIVAHSMGSIVVRAALNMSPIANLGRIVLIAPPNQGSPIARTASNFFGEISKPTCELSDDQSSYVCRMNDQHDFDIGIIVAKYDLLVPLNNTYLKSAREHVVLNGTHNSLLFCNTAIRLTSQFLETGSFDRVIPQPV